MSCPHFSFDVETNHPTTKSDKSQDTWDMFGEERLVGISFAWNNTSMGGWSPGDAAYLPLAKADDRDYWGQRQDRIWYIVEDILSNSSRKNAFNQSGIFSD